MFFIAIADLKIFTWCNVIQQIKKASPDIVYSIPPLNGHLLKQVFLYVVHYSKERQNALLFEKFKIVISSSLSVPIKVAPN